MNVLSRLTAVPFSRRWYQVSNGVINLALGGWMGIVHLVEYPRCGGTWIRHLMQDAMDIPQYAYDRRLTARTIIQCHALPNPGIRKAVVLFRDPRDTMASFYHKKVHYDRKFRNGQPTALRNYRHDPDRPVEEDFAAFLEAQLTQPDHPRFSYGEFARKWLAEKNTCVVRYEDFIDDAARELKKLCAFVGKTVSDEKIAWSVERNSFANRSKRRSGQERKPGEADSNQFERKGIVGDWVNTFNAEARQTFLRYEGETLIRLGYETDDSWVSDG